MAIRIVDKGPHKSVVKETVCTNCGATLEYTPSDVKEDRRYDYTGGVDIYDVIECPNCGHKHIVP